MQSIKMVLRSNFIKIGITKAETRKKATSYSNLQIYFYLITQYIV